MNSYRTHSCDALRLSDAGQTVTLSGWVDTVRDHAGVLFLYPCDREGKPQVVFPPHVNARLA